MKIVHEKGVDPMEVVVEANPYSIQVCIDAGMDPDDLRCLIEHLNQALAKQVAEAHPNLIGRGNPEGSAPSQADWEEHANLSDHTFKTTLNQPDFNRVKQLYEGWGDKALLN